MDTVVVVIAHGSRAEVANEAHGEAVAALDRRVAATVVRWPRPAPLQRWLTC